MLKEIEGFQLSPQQKHLWQLQRTNSLPYCAHCAILIEGNLNNATLIAALEQVVNRYEILRTTYRCLPGMTIPLQFITERGIDWNQNFDLSSYTADEQEVKLQALFHQFMQQPFNLLEGPVVRSSLITLSSQKNVLFISLPALCADAATLQNLVKEIGKFYSYVAGYHREELSDEPLQYADLAAWQNELLQGFDTEIGRSYWCDQDFSAVQAIQLPWEKQLVAEIEFDPRTYTCKIDSHLSAEIAILAQDYNTSVGEILLAYWIVLLWHLTGKQNLVIGVAFDGRQYEELRSALGLLSKYVPLFQFINQDEKFSDCLHKIKEDLSNNYQDREYFGWEHLAELPPDISHFFPLCFEYEKQQDKYASDALSFSIYKQFVCIDQFKLKLSCFYRDNYLNAEFHYDSSLFRLDDIERLAGQFQTLIQGFIDKPRATISELEILSEREKYQLLVEFNDTQADYPQDKCIHHLFEEQAARIPDAIAVVFEDQMLTYTKLNTRANQLAHYLQRQGVGPEVLVGIYVERSLEFIVGMLGILKAGGAYLPLDPALPVGGLASRFQDAQIPILLTQKSLVRTLPPSSARLVCLDTDWQEIAQESDSNPTSSVSGKSLIYVLFTSGSTGKPKGVAIEHRQLLNYLHGILNRLDLPTGSSFATVSTFAADLGNTVIFPALCTGGCLHVISQERVTDPDTLADYCRRHAIDCLKIVPSHLLALLETAAPKSILPRQRLVLGGEVASWDLIKQLQQLAPNCRILNHYGPTEATVGVLTYLVEPEQTRPNSKTVPLGCPLANTQVYLLDQYQNPVPIGVPGELYIGGASLARSYLNSPDLTAEKFIPNPFSDEPGARLYITGDLGRYLPDGNIEYLGRIDNQVKIRGFRVELGEIEAVLSLYPSVCQAVVIAREDAPGDKRLVAYLVPNQEPAPKVSDLRSFLKTRLPEYMIPSVIVILDRLPLTPNGKVDRLALPASEGGTSDLQNAFLAPRDTLELQLAKIWEQVLGTSPVGVKDNFFELGGHSLLAVNLMTQIQRRFGQSLPLTKLFQAATVEQLASILRQQQGCIRWSPLVEIQPGGSKRPFFCVHPIGGNVLCYIDLARYLGSDQPFYGFQAKGLDGQHQPYRQVEEMAADYIRVLRVVQPQGPYLLGGWSMGGVVAFEMAQQLQKQGDLVALLALLDSRITNYADKNNPGYFDEIALLTYFAKDLGGHFGKELSLSYAALQHLTLDEQLSYILEQAKLASILPEEVEIMQFQPLVEVFKTNLHALQSYVPQVYANRITLFQAEEILSEGWRDYTSYWGKLTADSVDIYTVSGNHYTMLTRSRVQDLAAKLKHCLDEYR